MRFTTTLVPLIDRVMQRVYLATGGRVGHHLLGWRFLLLTTTGRKTGLPRRHALIYLGDGARLLVVASNNGAERPPAWFLNLVANPAVQVRVGRAEGLYTARLATDAERPKLWRRLVAYHGLFAAHQRHARRTIPVVILTPHAP